MWVSPRSTAWRGGANPRLGEVNTWVKTILMRSSRNNVNRRLCSAARAWTVLTGDYVAAPFLPPEAPDPGVPNTESMRIGHARSARSRNLPQRNDGRLETNARGACANWGAYARGVSPTNPLSPPSQIRTGGILISAFPAPVGLSPTRTTPSTVRRSGQAELRGGVAPPVERAALSQTPYKMFAGPSSRIQVGPRVRALHNRDSGARTRMRTHTRTRARGPTSVARSRRSRVCRQIPRLTVPPTV